MASNCEAFYKVKSGDDCGKIATQCGITTEQLSSWNADIGSTCSGLWPDYYICVSVEGVDSQPTTTTTTKGKGVATPTPTQSGMIGTCNKFYRVEDGDTCKIVANEAGITLDTFYKWNKGVGSSCESLWLQYYVCIGVM
ncbi:Peptidoglycan-binding Lysin subgroup [Penicillium italicum]|uniref:Peptidoglycan-binding Lysin subgroup n=1 Tax=Penicillium italicum TaxID=40296 RepID=A0A0A2LIY0_PENIT|nr:Peptidoglycan-binding Lysin subgroup [Penicillium italicum]